MELPIIHDAASAASALVNYVSAVGVHFYGIDVQAAPYTSALSPVVGAVNIVCSTAEGLSMHRLRNQNHTIGLQVSCLLV